MTLASSLDPLQKISKLVILFVQANHQDKSCSMATSLYCFARRFVYCCNKTEVPNSGVPWHMIAIQPLFLLLADVHVPAHGPCERSLDDQSDRQGQTDTDRWAGMRLSQICLLYTSPSPRDDY